LGSHSTVIQARLSRAARLALLMWIDGFWIHRALASEDWVTSHVVDAASIAVSRRHRRTKTDRIDGETLVRTLMAWIRGEPRVCSMVRVPKVEDEDRRRIGRERRALVKERTLHTNRIKGLLFSVGIRGYEPNRRDRRERLEELRTNDGKPLPSHLKAQLSRELDRLELLDKQIKCVEAERDDMSETSPQATLAMLKGIPSPRGDRAQAARPGSSARPRDNQRQQAAVAPRQPTSNITLASDNHEEHTSNNAVTDSDPD
jgi:transposase